MGCAMTVYNNFMKNTVKYKSNRNIVYSCKYHIVWCPKYRRKVLIDDVEKRPKEKLKWQNYLKSIR